MDRKELIKKYVEYFESKNHKEIKNSSLVPENDPTVLFTTAGMHPLVPYLLGEDHPQGKRLVNVQRCIRTGDIDEVGDPIHHTLFEMMGNWSLGDYSKKEAIGFSFEFLTKILKIPEERLAVTCFKGDKDAPKDEEAARIWKSLGIKKISFLGKKDNWWDPAGKTGPCGPDSEIFVDGVEIWNDVFMQYNKDKDGNYLEAKQKNIDTGMGVERMITILEGLNDNYLASMWKPIIEKIEEISNKKYGEDKETTRYMRIIADHLKASTFIIADGIIPGNAEQGYVLRRLIRRAIRELRKIGVQILEMDATVEIARVVIDLYDDYDVLQENKKNILKELKKEEDKFQKTLDKGLREFEKMCSDNTIDGKEAFLLYQSYGFPIEIIRELAEEKGISVDEKGFKKESEKHQKLSQTASAGKFKSGLADDSEATKKLHTTCHLLNEALRIVLDKPDLSQRGSNITSERLRFDFNFDRKLTPEEIKDIEDMVNLKIKSNLPIICDVMPLREAKEGGAGGVFDDKYKEDVKVYRIGAISKEFSKEICAGPHVNNTSELGHFKITKEQSSSSGVRRIKAILE
jgi:alanyl-tRNA synthetase